MPKEPDSDKGFEKSIHPYMQIWINPYLAMYDLRTFPQITPFMITGADSKAQSNGCQTVQAKNNPFIYLFITLYPIKVSYIIRSLYIFIFLTE